MWVFGIIDLEFLLITVIFTISPQIPLRSHSYHFAQDSEIIHGKDLLEQIGHSNVSHRPKCGGRRHLGEMRKSLEDVYFEEESKLQ